jgi:hypothetical protein
LVNIHSNFRVTKYLAIDCEMDMIVFEDDQSLEHLACKISLVNESGQTVLDTLINYEKKAV